MGERVGEATTCSGGSGTTILKGASGSVTTVDAGVKATIRRLVIKGGSASQGGGVYNMGTITPFRIEPGQKFGIGGD